VLALADYSPTGQRASAACASWPARRRNVSPVSTNRWLTGISDEGPETGVRPWRNRGVADSPPCAEMLALAAIGVGLATRVFLMAQALAEASFPW